MFTFMLRASLIVSVLWLMPAMAWSAPPVLDWPAACTPNRDCWIANHVDLDPGPGIRDYRCGSLTYEGHDGTDIAIRDRAAMTEGVAVLAAAAGRVRASRDGVADANVRESGKQAIKGRECGNGVVIDHGDGWETQYCHLRSGSVRVKRSEQVAAGQALGMAGLSGLTEYPHLHFSVRHRGRTVDPFRGEEGGPDCAAGPGAPGTLWRDNVAAKLPYAPGAVYNAGFAPEAPGEEGIRTGKYRKNGVLRADAPMLVFYAEVFGVSVGDALRLRITSPDGAVLAEQRIAIERQQARRLGYIGKRKAAGNWAPGIYRGEAQLIHADGRQSAASIQTTTIEVRQ